MEEIRLFAGNTSHALAREIANHLDIPVGELTQTRFADGEIKMKIEENIRGRDVFFVQSTMPPADNILELLLFLDAARRASAERITAVLPYFGYGRQDRKDEPRVPISAKLIANLIATSGADRVLTMDLHAEQIQGFFDIPVDHLYAAPVLIDYYHQRPFEQCVVISPDAGRVNRVRAFARRLGQEVPIAIVDKRRTGPNQSMVANIVGEVADKTCLLYDDMLDTGGTMVEAAQAVMEKGARQVFACVVHPLLSRNAVARVDASAIKELVITNTIPLPPEKRSVKIKVLSIAPLLGEAIKRIHRSESISSLFKEVRE